MSVSIYMRMGTGDLVYLNICGQSIVVLNTMTAVKDLLESQSDIYSDRPSFTFLGELMGLDKVSVINSLQINDSHAS
jgi:hypothetical protein